MEYESAKVRQEFLDEVEIEVCLQKLRLFIDKLRFERKVLEQKKSVAPPAPAAPPLLQVPLRSTLAAAKAIDRKKLTTEKAAEYLGIAVQTVYQWCSEKKIPYYKVGRKAFFDADKLDTWRAKGEVKPISEIVRAKRVKSRAGESER